MKLQFSFIASPLVVSNFIAGQLTVSPPHALANIVFPAIWMSQPPCHRENSVPLPISVANHFLRSSQFCVSIWSNGNCTELCRKHIQYVTPFSIHIQSSSSISRKYKPELARFPLAPTAWDNCAFCISNVVCKSRQGRIR
ncbi:hypothetical protein ARMSODRAFT_10947 [Armillaria solidipes]|uniref:Uncharacterized protein n=1 Tax=Armillaria solidipes TaxID=1076256 RepID=A0A2H3CHF2_9AGAR|nr:hypothetical protein ARMSODRAFT_10947 [Armillaria solidipes]